VIVKVLYVIVLRVFILFPLYVFCMRVMVVSIGPKLCRLFRMCVAYAD
jgi:hypothetical protein